MIVNTVFLCVFAVYVYSCRKLISGTVSSSFGVYLQLSTFCYFKENLRRIERLQRKTVFTHIIT